MQTCCLVSQLIGDTDNNRISDGGFNAWTWPSTVDTNHRPFVAIWAGVDPCNIPIIGDGCAETQGRQAQQKRQWPEHVDAQQIRLKFKTSGS